MVSSVRLSDEEDQAPRVALPVDVLRRAVVAFAVQAGVAERSASCGVPTVGDVALCFTELATNALMHAQGPYYAVFDVRRAELRVTVSDGSIAPIGFPGGDDAGSGDDEGGRGLYLLTVFSQAQEYGRRDGRQYVRVCFDLPCRVAMRPVEYEVLPLVGPRSRAGLCA